MAAVAGASVMVLRQMPSWSRYTVPGLNGWEPDADGLTITIPAAKGRRHPTPTAARAPLGLPMSRVQPGSNESDGPSGS